MASQTGSRMEPAIHRPSLIRSQSSIEPSKRPHPMLDLSPPRPDGTANSPLFLSPADARLQTSSTVPSEPTSSKLHISKTPGLRRFDHDRRTPSRHRHTQSDAPSDHMFGIHRRDKSETLPHLAAGIAKERGRRLDQTRLPHALRGIRSDDLRRMPSNESDRAPRTRLTTKGATMLRRVSSDPKIQARQAGKPQVEMLLELAEAKKMANRAVSQKDVDKIRRRNVEEEAALKRRLATINQTSVDILRRLDQTYYALRKTVGNLVATVHAFDTLSSQSKAMIDAFTEAASTLESDIQSKAETFTVSFDKRQDRVRRLEERGGRAQAQAQDLSSRLEKSRLRLAVWEKKDGAERRRRSWFWRSTWTTLATATVLIFFALTWQEWRSQAELVRLALSEEASGPDDLNQTLPVDGTVVPGKLGGDQVQSIASKASEGRRSLSASTSSQTRVSAGPDESWLKLLDDL